MERTFTIKSSKVRLLAGMIMTLLIIPCLAFEQVNTKITLNYQNTEISKVLQSIEKQSGYTFFYSGGTIDASSLISINVKQTPIEKVLDELLEPFKVEYQFKDKSIILKKQRAVVVTEVKGGITDTSKNILVKGKILNDKGNGLAGVTVSVKGEPVNAITNENGNFELNVPKASATLIFSSIGYENQEVKVKNNTIVSIVMRERVTELQKVEVVSTGYQEIPKERATGSFSLVDNELFNRRVGSNVLDRLNDVVPGLVKNKQTNINPLSAYQIRGVSTINAETTPLLVVDNFIFEGDPSTINPNDIENVTVLKDAAAASIWGVRAGNGVIVITTKKGKPNRKATLSFNTNFSISNKPNFRSIPSVPSKDIVSLETRRFQEGYYDSYLTNPYAFDPLPLVAEILYKNKLGTISNKETEALINELKNTDIRSEIQKYLTQNPSTQQYSISISGGSDKNQYYASFGYDKSVPSDINVKNERLTFRWNNSWQPIKGLSITTEMNWIKADYNSNNNLATPGTTRDKLFAYTYNKISDEVGNPLPIQYDYRTSYIDTVSAPGLLDWHFYPINEAKDGQSKSQSNEIRFFGAINYRFSGALSASLQYQYQNSTGEIKDIYSTNLYTTRSEINSFVQTDPTTGNLIYPIPLGSKIGRNTSKLSSWNIRGNINFNKSIGRHNIVAIAAVERRETNQDQNDEVIQYGYNHETNTVKNLLPGLWMFRPYEYQMELAPLPARFLGRIDRFGSYLANASYTYDNKYIITASGRIDQSNFFGVKTNDRIVPLGSVGIAWNLTNESFLKTKSIDKLSLRVTYGFSGNVNPGTSPFATATYLSPTQPTNIPFARLVTAPNPKLGWEKVKHVNLASEFSFFNNRLSGTLEFYVKYGMNLISPIKSAPSTGFLQYNGNNASIKTKGMDLNLTNNNKIGQLTIKNILLLSYNTNKVTNYLVTTPLGQVSPGSFNNSPLIGKPIDKLYTYKWAGLSAENGDALLYIKDKVVGSRQFRTATFEDFEYHGRQIPSWTGAWRTEVGWRNFSTSIGLNYRFKSVFLRSSFNGRVENIKNLVHEDYLFAWKKPGDEKNTNVPGFADFYPDRRYNVYNQSSILVESGDIIQLQDIRLNCDLTPYLKNVTVISKFNLYFYVDNIGPIWKQSKYDPRIDGSFTYNTNLTTFFGGLSVQF